MDAIANIGLGVFHGLWDSIRGMTILFYIDREINRHMAEKEAERQRRLLTRQQFGMRRSPSPTPSSASAMIREEGNVLTGHMIRESPDERRLQSIRNHLKSPEQQKLQNGEKKIAKRVLSCCALNGGCAWLSIIIFELGLVPMLKSLLTLCYGENSQELHMIWGWIQPIIAIIFSMMWVVPIFLICKVVNSLWFADIANAAFRVRKGRPKLMLSISKFVADILFNLVVQSLFLGQTMLISCVPIRYVSTTLCYLHLCLLYSLYSFEYKWLNMGWELHRRLSYIENNWPYFLGFGLPLAFLTNMSESVVVSSCIFSIFFPLFILSGNEAKPLVGTTETPLRLFSLVIYLSNKFFNRSGARRQRMIAPQNKITLQPEQPLELNLPHQLKHYNRIQKQHDNIPSQPQPEYRYQQPPSRPVHTPSQNPTFSSQRTLTPERVDRHYNGGMQPPLIPTVVPGAPTGHNRR